MQEKSYNTPSGTIRYWINTEGEKKNVQLVFLPGLTADHRLFDKQIEYFEDRYPVFVWDAPGHASSWPFELDFTLNDKAKWLDEILTQEGFDDPVIIGQSMGGYVGQMYAELFPEKIRGFVSIDSAPLQKQYMKDWEIWLLKRMEPVYRYYPWKLLLKQGTEGVATSPYGRQLMRDMMMTYDGDQGRYARLAGHGYRMLAEAVEEDRPYVIKCPALLVCGTEDHAGSCIRYNKAWHRVSGIPIKWIEGAGHNSNTDRPEEINRLITEYLLSLEPFPMQSLSDMTFRKCEDADLEQVLDLYRRVLQQLRVTVNYPKWGVHHPNKTDLTRACERGELYVLLAGGRAAGAVVLNDDPGGCYEAGDWSKDLTRGDYMVIHMLAADPLARNVGMGGYMVDRCVDIARERGYKAIRLDVVPGNDPAIRLYMSKGFTYAGTKDLKLNIKAIPEFSLYELDLEQ